MRLVILSYVGNEEDVIEAFVRHNSQFSDRMIVVATGKDRTLSILQSLRDEGLSVEPRPHRTDFHDQRFVLTRLLHEAGSTYNPDWILPLDADEFLCFRDTDPAQAFSALPDNAVTQLPWRTYVPNCTDTSEDTNPLLRIRHRRAKECPEFSKILIPRSFHSAEWRIGPGSHELIHVRGSQTPPTSAAANMYLAHLPVRSSNQLRLKIEHAWKRHLANPYRQHQENFHWENILKNLEQDPVITPQRLEDFARSYAWQTDIPLPPLIEDALPCTFSLRYTPAPAY